MLTVRREQLVSLADASLCRFHDQMLDRVTRGFPDTVAGLGRDQAGSLVAACVKACRNAGWTGAPTIALAVDSAFRQPERAFGGIAQTVQAVMLEMQALELRSRIETLASLTDAAAAAASVS